MHRACHGKGIEKSQATSQAIGTFNQLVIRKGNLTPGSAVSVDQCVSTTLGRSPNTQGEESENNKCHGWTITVDHASQCTFIHNQVSLNVREPWKPRQRLSSQPNCGRVRWIQSWPMVLMQSFWLPNWVLTLLVVAFASVWLVEIVGRSQNDPKFTPAPAAPIGLCQPTHTVDCFNLRLASNMGTHWLWWLWLAWSSCKPKGDASTACVPTLNQQCGCCWATEQSKLMESSRSETHPFIHSFQVHRSTKSKGSSKPEDTQRRSVDKETRKKKRATKKRKARSLLKWQAVRIETSQSGKRKGHRWLRRLN